MFVTGVVHPLRSGATVHGRPGVGTHRLSRRRRGICNCRGTTLALREISCRLHDGWLLAKWIARSSMRTPPTRSGGVFSPVGVREQGLSRGDGPGGAEGISGLPAVRR
ncbi:FIG01121292: hypothetical protein [Streptomyces venezuelae]|nr:FIG01121292: hypothetical protein [Streptomyces venezuelae]